MNFKFVCATVFSLCSNTTFATVLVNTVNGPYSLPRVGYSVDQIAAGRASVALPFSSGSANVITNIYALIGGVSSKAIRLGVMEDSSGVPSGVFVYQRDVRLDPDQVIAPSLTHLRWSVDPMTNYWLAAVARPGANGYWAFSSTSTGVFAAASNGLEADWSARVGRLPEAIVTGAVTATRVSEPSQLSLFGLGALAALLNARRRRSRAGSA